MHDLSVDWGSGFRVNQEPKGCLYVACSPVYLPPAPAQATRDRPTARGVMLPWPGLAIPQAYTTLIRVNVMMTCRYHRRHPRPLRLDT